MDALNEWATDPNAAHVAVTPDAGDLEALFAQLAANISKPGATDIVINEKLNPDFVITDILSPSRGQVYQLGAGTLRWTLSQLGVNGSESAVLEFFVRHQGQTQGVKPVNESITYADAEGNVVRFPDPTVEVRCDVVVKEPCPEPVDLEVEGCADAAELDAGEIRMGSLGRIVCIDVTIKSVCPDRRVALAAILTEVDAAGTEHSRGMKTMTIPAHSAPGCRDVQVKGIAFVVPEDLDVSGGTPYALCNPRRFRVRFLANNVDTDYRCCVESLSP